MEAGGKQKFSMPLELNIGTHDLEVIVDPHQHVIEPQATQANNRAQAWRSEKRAH